jgi:hypothetical protein
VISRNLSICTNAKLSGIDYEGSVANMESTYYNLVAPASYERLSKFKPNGYTKKEVREWLQSQDTYTLHKPIRRRFPRRRVVVYGIGHQWQADLVDVSRLSSYNKGFKYLLSCIDVLSRYSWVIRLNDKTGETLVALLPPSWSRVYAPCICRPTKEPTVSTESSRSF